MRPIDIRSYLDILKREKELCIIDLPVDPYLELAEIQRRTVARQGPALLFTNVKDTAFPVVTNLFGTRRRIELAFGEDPSRFVRRVAEAVERLATPVTHSALGLPRSDANGLEARHQKLPFRPRPGTT